MSWYVRCLRHYVDFSGRASRQEFWMFVLFNVIASVVLGVIDRTAGLTFGPNGTQGILSSVYSAAVLIPGIAVAVRRLHDIGKSGWHLFFAFIPCVGGFILLYWYVQGGEPGGNAYGETPMSASD